MRCFLSSNKNMFKKQFSGGLFACLMLSSSLFSSAFAGGFAVREQSTTGLGSSFAGVAAGNTPSSMYWNGATIANTTGLTTESSYNVIFADSEMISAVDGGVQIGSVGFAAASAATYQYSDKLFLGFSFAAPLGFKTSADPKNFSGSTLGNESSIFSVNANPVVAYKVTPSLTLSGGVQIEYFKVRLDSKLGAPAGSDGSVEGDDIGFGFTAGVMYQPNEGTTIGIGYRSSVSHDLEGDFSINGVKNSDITADFKSPDLLTVSLRQKVSPAVTLLGTVEWSKWSNLEELRIKKSDGTTLSQVDFNWKNGIFYSVGAEYEWDDKWTLRSGVAYEESPVPDSTRSVRLPDANRLWLSLGASYQWSEATTLSASYSHIFVEDSVIDQPAFAADVETNLNIISVGFKTKW